MRLAREDVADARIARRELGGVRIAEQREHADGLAAGLQQRAGKNAIRNRAACRSALRRLMITGSWRICAIDRS